MLENNQNMVQSRDNSSRTPKSHRTTKSPRRSKSPRKTKSPQKTKTHRKTKSHRTSISPSEPTSTREPKPHHETTFPREPTSHRTPTSPREPTSAREPKPHREHTFAQEPKSHQTPKSHGTPISPTPKIQMTKAHLLRAEAVAKTIEADKDKKWKIKRRESPRLAQTVSPVACASDHQAAVCTRLAKPKTFPLNYTDKKAKTRVSRNTSHKHKKAVSRLMKKEPKQAVDVTTGMKQVKVNKPVNTVNKPSLRTRAGQWDTTGCSTKWLSSRPALYGQWSELVGNKSSQRTVTYLSEYKFPTDGKGDLRNKEKPGNMLNTTSAENGTSGPLHIRIPVAEVEDDSDDDRDSDDDSDSDSNSDPSTEAVDNEPVPRPIEQSDLSALSVCEVEYGKNPKSHFGKGGPCFKIVPGLTKPSYKCRKKESKAFHKAVESLTESVVERNQRVQRWLCDNGQVTPAGIQGTQANQYTRPKTPIGRKTTTPLSGSASISTSRNGLSSKLIDNLTSFIEHCASQSNASRQFQANEKSDTKAEAPDIVGSIFEPPKTKPDRRMEQLRSSIQNDHAGIYRRHSYVDVSTKPAKATSGLTPPKKDLRTNQTVASRKSHGGVKAGFPSISNNGNHGIATHQQSDTKVYVPTTISTTEKPTDNCRRCTGHSRCTINPAHVRFTDDSVAVQPDGDGQSLATARRQESKTWVITGRHLHNKPAKPIRGLAGLRPSKSETYSAQPP